MQDCRATTIEMRDVVIIRPWDGLHRLNAFAFVDCNSERQAHKRDVVHVVPIAASLVEAEDIHLGTLSGDSLHKESQLRPSSAMVRQHEMANFCGTIGPRRNQRMMRPPGSAL